MSAVLESPVKLSLTRHIDAPPEQVFDAWLQKSWGEWAGPPGVRGEVIQLEPRVGGSYRIVMHSPDRPDLTVSGIYREIVRPSRLVMTWKWDHEEQDTLITLSFKPSGKGTEIVLLHENFATPERRDNHQNGWISTFDRLAHYVA
jgi:uncharacterized protein YndB with AHSA1/START domain